MYFITEGKVSCWFCDVLFKTNKQGAYFGEVDALFNNPRTYSTTAAQPSELLSIERTKFIEILDRFPEIADEVITLARVRL